MAKIFVEAVDRKAGLVWKIVSSPCIHLKYDEFPSW